MSDTSAGSHKRDRFAHRQQFAVAVLAANDIDAARFAGITNSVTDGDPDAGDVIKSIVFEPRAFAREMAAHALRLPEGRALPRLVRVPSDEPATDAPFDAAEWRAGFTKQELERQTGLEPSPADADGILVLLPPVRATLGGEPRESGEAIAARYSLWLMLLLSEVQRAADIRAARRPSVTSLPIAFVVATTDERQARASHATFSREIDLFRMLVGDVHSFTLGNSSTWNPEVVQFFAKRFAVTPAPHVERAREEHGPKPAAEPREIRRPGLPRAFAQAAGIVALAGSLAAGYMWYATRDTSALTAAASVEVEARAALAAAFEAPDALPDSLRHTRLRYALAVCKRPSASCAMEDVLRLGSELNRLRWSQGD